VSREEEVGLKSMSDFPVRPLVIKGVSFFPLIGSGIFVSLSERWLGRLFGFLHRRYWDEMTFVSRPVTLLPCKSGKKTLIKRKFFSGNVLVARSYDNNGIDSEAQNWLSRTQPFFVNFVSLKELSAERVAEFAKFVDIFRRWSKKFSCEACVIIDSTPHHNLQLVDHDVAIAEFREMLDIALAAGVIAVPQVSVAMPVDVAATISEHSGCEAISLISGIPWGGRADRIDWRGIFGSHESPFSDCGNGELYGTMCLPIVRDWVEEAKL